MSNLPPEIDLTHEAAAAGDLASRPILAGTAPKRPDITPAQIVAFVPILADLGHSFGIFALSQAEQNSLKNAVLAGIALFGADAVIRLGRNLAHRAHLQ